MTNKQDDLVSSQSQRFHTDFNLHPVTASEIEFYLIGANTYPSLPEFWQELSVSCAHGGIRIFKTDKENGHEQYEVALAPGNDPLKLAKDTHSLKGIIGSVAATHHLIADFSAKPFADQPGSGLHVHVHMVDKQGKNVFFKDNEIMSPALQYSIGGLMAWLNPCMAVFAPHLESYTRFGPKSNAPVTVSWGANNRTVAIRLPDTEHSNKRIEHRVSGADADPVFVMAVVLAGMHYGIQHRCDPGQQIFGDASLPAYNLPKIITSLDEAKEAFYKSPLFEGYFSAADLLPVQ